MHALLVCLHVCMLLGNCSMLTFSWFAILVYSSVCMLCLFVYIYALLGNCSRFSGLPVTSFRDLQHKYCCLHSLSSSSSLSLSFGFVLWFDCEYTLAFAAYRFSSFSSHLSIVPFPPKQEGATRSSRVCTHKHPTRAKESSDLQWQQ
jgi:hypothetical protein